MGKIEKILGSRFREYREKRDISQLMVAKLAKTSSHTVNRFENGRQMPHDDTLAQMLKAIGLDHETFLFGEISNNERALRADLLLTIISRLTALDNSQLGGVLGFINEFSDSQALPKSARNK